MAKVEKLSVTLTEEQAKLVRQAVKTGAFATTSEVIREALRTWQSERQLEALSVEELRRLWRQGLASGRPRSGPAAMARLAKRYAGKSKP